MESIKPFQGVITSWFFTVQCDLELESSLNAKREKGKVLPFS